MPHDVTMPQLGMAQDAGRIVAWLKKPGERVAAGDALFEVETDKATMEVEAQAGGFLTDVRAGEGEDVPVGRVIARISETAEDATPAPEAAAPEPEAAPPAPSPVPAPPPVADVPASPARSAPQVAPASLPNGRILASPKARKRALERGIDLSRLAAAGVAQPFHLRDVEGFVSAAPASAAPRRIAAETLHDGFTPFAAWAAEDAGLADAAALLAGFAAASLRAATAAEGPVCIAIVGQGAERRYIDPDRALGRTPPAGAAHAPALVVSDLRGGRITSADTGPGPAPVLSVGGRGSALTVTLVWADGQLSPDAALALADGFAGRLEDPLRHLL